MKFAIQIVLGLVTAGSFVTAQPHNHHHRHAGKRAPTPVVEPPPTVTKYKLNGSFISEAEADQGLKDGFYTVVGNSGPPPPLPAKPSSTSSSTSTPAATSDKGAGQFYAVPSSSSAPAAAPSGTSGGKGLDAPFPDGTLDCSHFPSDYGPIALDYLNLGGWSGVQSGGTANIRTAIAGETCTEGSFCSYACPPGYQKSQWPSTQGDTHQSIGGVLCSGGKLKLTNSNFETLCIKGSGGVKVLNKISKNVPICRTDYPGTEDMTIPLDTLPGQTFELTCPSASNYYIWTGKPTSAQYYINPAGTPVEKACQWDTAGSNMGNWAPVVLGVGQVDGATWISLSANTPTRSDASGLDFSIEIVGDNLGGKCRYSNGQFMSLTGNNGAGCTVQVMSGEATYVIS